MINTESTTESVDQAEDEHSGCSEEQPVFALDIGTRSVIGIVGIMQEEKLQILGFNKVEHSKRAMIDGQIEDIEQVSKCIKQVKENLEKQLKVNLSTVAIAAAGRALQTQKATIECVLNPGETITEDTIRLMEMEAIEQAQSIILQEGRSDSKTFYCVGHTVTSFVLDGYEMSTVLGHIGSSCIMTLIAAFLPKIVVESLYAAMDRSDLEVKSLTLEPIAAMNVVIPSDIRMLNLALVDIGAGTSDIAISKAGAVTAYDMVMEAGDEITEAIMQNYLVDFATAEQIKQTLADHETITFTDILGLEQEVTRTEIMASASKAVEQLVDLICRKILQLNGAAPTALFLVGGGSMYPGLTTSFAQKLEMDVKRVAIGGKTHLQKLVTGYEAIASPEFITPIGIALTSVSQHDYDFATVTVNGKKVRQFRYEGLKVSDVLILTGDFKYDQLIGCMGKRLRFELNGRVQTISGDLAKPAEILINGQPATLENTVRPGDDIELTVAENGQSVVRTVGQVVPECHSLFITLDDVVYEAGLSVKRNGYPARAEDTIKDGDSLTTASRETLAMFLDSLGIAVNDKVFSIGGNVIEPDYRLQNGDQIVSQQTIKRKGQIQAAGSDVFQSEAVQTDQRLIFYPGKSIMPSAALSITLNSKKLQLPAKEDGSAYMLFDLFNFIDSAVLEQRDRVLNCTINGREQPFTTILRSDDIIKIQ